MSDRLPGNTSQVYEAELDRWEVRCLACGWTKRGPGWPDPRTINATIRTHYRETHPHD